MLKEYKTWIRDDYDILPAEVTGEHCFPSKEEAKQFCLNAVFLIASKFKINFHVLNSKNGDILFFIDNHQMARVYPCY